MKGFSGFKGSPAKKELIGGQKNLPDGLKAKIEAAPGKMYDSPVKQEGPIPKKNLKLQEGEMEGTYIYPGGDKSERIADYEDRVEFARSDAESSEGEEKKQHLANAKKLQHEADIIRNRKSPGKMYGKKSPAKQTKFPNSPKAKERKMLKVIKSIKFPDGPVGPSPNVRKKAELRKAIEAEIKKRKAESILPESKKSPAKQTKFPNSLKARKRKVLKEEKNLKPMDPKMMKKLYPRSYKALMKEKNK